MIESFNYFHIFLIQVRGGAVENILRGSLIYLSSDFILKYKTFLEQKYLFLNKFILGLSSQISEREDATLCADIRNKVIFNSYLYSGISWALIMS